MISILAPDAAAVDRVHLDRLCVLLPIATRRRVHRRHCRL
jgi:hypothetical protein